MAIYPVFSQENGQRVAINPELVISIFEIEPGRVSLNLPDGGSVTIQMELDAVIALLTGQRFGARPNA